MFAHVLLACWLFVMTAVQSFAAEPRFVGDVVGKLASDGRNIILTEPFGYVDSNGRHWNVPAGAETDGASVPQAFWIAYPPFTGLYRSAAVIHDYYCQQKERTWQDTHNVFYDAMITAGVDQKTAKVMWSAVYYMGPRWVTGRRGPSTRGPGPSDVSEQKILLEKLEQWIARENPTRTEIEVALGKGVIP